MRKIFFLFGFMAVVFAANAQSVGTPTQATPVMKVDQTPQPNTTQDAPPNATPATTEAVKACCQQGAKEGKTCCQQGAAACSGNEKACCQAGNTKSKKNSKKKK